jgi:hypothetical protein
MVNGTINFTQSKSSGAYIDGKILWYSEADNNANSSYVTASLYVRKGDTTQTLTIPTAGNWSYSMNINGTKVSGTVNKSVLEDWVLLCTQTVRNIAHNADGSKSVSISGSVGAPAGTAYDGHTTDGASTVNLETVPRAASITSASDTTLGGKCTVKWSPSVSNFYYKLKFYMTNWVYNPSALNNVSSAATTISLEAAKQIPNATTGTMNVALYTYSDSECTKQVGSVSTKTFTVTVPNNSSTIPDVSMTLTPVHSLTPAFNGLYIQGKTKVQANISAEGQYNATIKNTVMQVDNKTYDAGVNTSDYLSMYGTVYVYGAAQDSRGFANVAQSSIDVIPYSKPRILPVSGENSIVCARCNSDGTLSDSGTYLKIKARRSYSKVMSGDTQKNFCQIRARYKVEGGSYFGWQTILPRTSLDSDEVITDALIGTLSPTSVYVVQVQAIDDTLEYDLTTVTIPTDKVYWHRDGARRSLALGEYVTESNTFSVAEDITTKFKGPVRFVGEEWLSLGLSSDVSEATFDGGRCGKGCYYRVCAGEKHIYVALNCSFATTSSTIRVNADAIPSEYRPANDVFALCAAVYADGGMGVVNVGITPKTGIVNIYAVHRLSGTAPSSGETVAWIDGYIDFWT